MRIVLKYSLSLFVFFLCFQGIASPIKTTFKNNHPSSVFGFKNNDNSCLASETISDILNDFPILMAENDNEESVSKKDKRIVGIKSLILFDRIFADPRFSGRKAAHYTDFTRLILFSESLFLLLKVIRI